MREIHYNWQWHLPATPEQLWPLVSDTNRFNLDAKVPPLEDPRASKRERNAKRQLVMKLFGVPIKWTERPFEWVKPQRFGVLREYQGGLFEYLNVLVEMEAKDQGTLLTYQVWIKPRNIFGVLAAKVQLGVISKRSFEKSFHEYAQLVKDRQPALGQQKPRFVPGGKTRLENMCNDLSEDNNQQALAGLRELITKGDDLAVFRMRPVALAHLWQQPEDEVIALFLQATRVGLLDFRWELLCPYCRGAKSNSDHLDELADEVHCETCNIDYRANFDQSVELTFKPNGSIRLLSVMEFCVGSPQLTPHIWSQQLLAPGEKRSFSINLEPGPMRFRAMEENFELAIQISEQGAPEATLELGPQGFAKKSMDLAASCQLTWINKTDQEQLLILERTSWDTQALTAARVTSNQVFRDLFSREALRPGQEISVGSLTLAFTDLVGSTRMYQEIGDAPAFGLVMDHFDVLKQEVACSGGALVKTVGDAIMASFLAPGPAVLAMLKAQQKLAQMPTDKKPLVLRAGVHLGPAIAVTLNERLDYFGTVVNMAARLEGQSKGSDVVVSEQVYGDPSIAALVKKGTLTAEPFAAELKGFAQGPTQLWRLKLA